VFAEQLDEVLKEVQRISPVESALQTRARRLDTITRDAATRSRFYAHRFAGLVPDSGPVDLHALPPLDKPELVEHFEEVVTNPTLRRDELLAQVGSVTADVLFRDELRVIATSRSSEFRGRFVYDRPAWARVMAGILRVNRWAGLTPSVPRLGGAFVSASNGAHMSRRFNASLDVGLYQIQNSP
jgi:phenylacetate-CoA ligase